MLSRALAALTLAAAALPAAAQTADEIVARSIEARGGLAAIKAVHSVRMSGRMKMGPTEASIVVEIKRGAGVRTELEFPDARVVQAYDGKQAWGIPPGSGVPERLPAEAAKQLAQQADLEGVLVDYKAKGHKVELVREPGAASEHYRLRVTFKGGDVDDYLIDAKSGLLVRVESRREVSGQLVEGQTAIGGYEEAGGWKWPRSIENSVKGRPERQAINFEKVEVNPAIDDARFRMPATASPTRR